MRYILSLLLFTFIIGSFHLGSSSVAFAEEGADTADQTTNDADKKAKKKKKKKEDGSEEEEEEPECDE